MHTRHRVVLAAAAALALALAGGTLAACGDPDQTTDGSPSPTALSPSPEASTPSPATTGPTSSPILSPSPSPLDTKDFSEEELAKATEDSLQQVVQATEEAAQTAESASSDGAVSADEATQIVVSCQNAEQLVGYANSVFQAYSSEYAAYADALTGEMEQMTMYLMDIDEELGTLLEYADSAQASAEKLAAAAQEAATGARTTADQLATQTEQWAGELAAARSTWEAAARNTKPTKGADTRAGALQMAGVYLQTLNRTLQGGKLTKEDLQGIYQASVNAVASLEAQGGQLAKLGAEIDSLTGMLAKGDLPQVKAKLPEIESLFP